MNLQLLTGPVAEPVSLTQAKAFLVVDDGFTQDDLVISAFITAARQFAESYTNRAFFNQQWRLSLNYFPVWWPDHGTISLANRTDYLMGAYFMQESAIKLPYPTCVSVDSIAYVDLTGTAQTLDPTAYVLDATAEPALVVPTPGQYWPSGQALLPGSVKVIYTAGSYGDGETVNTCPQTVQTAILLLVGHLYANREAASQLNLKQLPFGVNTLLDTQKIYG